MRGLEVTGERGMAFKGSSNHLSSPSNLPHIRVLQNFLLVLLPLHPKILTHSSLPPLHIPNRTSAELMACRLVLRHCRKRTRSPSSYPSFLRHSSTTSSSSLLDLSHIGLAGFDTSSVQILPDVITPEEEARLVAELEGNVRRRRYVDNHWDSVIEKYREVEKREWIDSANKALAERIKALILQTLQRPPTLPFLPVHVIDLAEDGFIKPHVDSIKYSGDIVSGLSLCSPAIMQLKGDEEQGMDPTSIVRLLLRPRSLYILCGEARYKYVHEILVSPEGERWADGEVVARGRRLSLIFRDEKMQE